MLKKILTISNSTILPLSPIAVVSHIPRPKYTIQQPPSNPVGSILAVRTTAVEELSCEWTGIAPDFRDREALVVGPDMVPEEWRARGWVGAHAVEEVGGVLVHAVVDYDCFVLGMLVLRVWEWNMCLGIE